METQISKKKILLIEDSLTLGRKIVDVIKVELNLECEWLVRLEKERLDGNILVGYRLVRGQMELANIDLSEISVALIDGSLGDGQIPGWKIVQQLVRLAKITCVGISSSDGPILQEKGCAILVNKQFEAFETFLLKELRILHVQNTTM